MLRASCWRRRNDFCKTIIVMFQRLRPEARFTRDATGLHCVPVPINNIELRDVVDAMVDVAIDVVVDASGVNAAERRIPGPERLGNRREPGQLRLRSADGRRAAERPIRPLYSSRVRRVHAAGVPRGATVGAAASFASAETYIALEASCVAFP